MTRFLAHSLCRVLELGFGLAAVWTAALISEVLFR